MRKKFYLLTLVLLGIIAAIIVPICINESYKSLNGYVTLWDAKDVLSYYGAILGGIATLSAVLLTIYYEKQAQNEMRHDSVMPFLKVTGREPIHENDCIVQNVFFILPSTKEKTSKRKELSLQVENMGMGIANSIALSIVDEAGREYDIVGAYCLGINQKEIFILRFENAVECGKYKLVFKYNDVFKRRYKQEMELQFDESILMFENICPPQHIK